MVAVETGIPPAELWAADPADLATIADVLIERGNRARRLR